MPARIQKTTIMIARLLLGVVFVFSGFVKAVDPIGFGYKVEEYLRVMHIAFPEWINVPLVAGMAMSVVEFVLGVYLVLGIRRRFAAIATMLIMAVFSVVSLLLVMLHPVGDCGCFGDAVVLTDWQTLGKNVVLFALSLILASHPKAVPSLVTRGWQWFVSLYTFVFIFVFCVYSAMFIPLIDFRPYKIGANLRELVFPKEIKEGEMPLDFYVTDTLGRDFTSEILFDQQPVMLVVCPSLRDSKTNVTEELNTVSDWCVDNDYEMFCLTSSSQEEINEWSYYNDAQFPFLVADHTMLKTIVRSNPGLMLLHDGVIRNKWSSSDLPDLADTSILVADLEAKPYDSVQRVLRVIMWYLLPMMIIIVLSNSIRMLRRKRSDTNKKGGQELFDETETENLMLNSNKNTTNMRKKIVAGNWKMNMTLQEGVALAKELNEALVADKPNCGVVICTPFIHLATVAPMLDTEVVKLGAENCADQEKGAYTGEVSAAMVKSTGAEYVILGHSERRAYYGETPEILKEKVNLALANGLKVIFCIGEVLEDREAGKQNEVVAAQLAGSLYDLTAEQFSSIVLAYEPVWAIGTGKTATADQAQEMHAFIRAEIAKQFGAKAAENTTIQYGGSCKPSNAKELFAKPDVDGGLIGGAALKVADFKGIIDAWKA